MERDVLSRELETVAGEYESVFAPASLENSLDYFWPPLAPKAAATISAPVKLDEDRKTGYTAYVEIDLKIPVNPCYKGYFKKDGVSNKKEFVCSGAIKGSVQKKTALFAPSHLNVHAPVDVVVYLHGHLGAHPGIKKINHSPCIKEYLNYSGARYFQLREAIEAGKRNAVLVAPTLGPRSQYGTIAKQFDAYMENVLAGIREHIIRSKKTGGDFEFGKLIIAAHSGGGSAMLQICASNNKYAKKIAEVWGFDSWYNGTSPWENVAKLRPALKIYGYHFNSSYLPHKPAAKIKRAQKANFFTARVANDAPSLDHFTLLPYYFKERIADEVFIKAPTKENETVLMDDELLFTKNWNAAQSHDLIDQRFDFEWQDAETADPLSIQSPYHYSKFKQDRADNDFFQFKAKVYQAHVNWAASAGKPFVADQAAVNLKTWTNKEDLTYSVKKGKKIYKGVTVHKRMEEPLKRLLEKAREDAKREGKDMNVYITNGYRSASTQFNSWDSNFKTYYDRAIREAGLKRGDYSSNAVINLSKFIRAKLGAPGYSNHQHGRAVDFFLLEWNAPQRKKLAYQVSTRKANVDKWRTTWFWKWLVQHAADFGFCPYDKEPWHWEYWQDVDPTLARCKQKSSVVAKAADNEIELENMELEITSGTGGCRLPKFKKHKKGYSAYGGGRLDAKLKQLRLQKKISVTSNDILLLQELARTESGGLVQAINSWDSAYMSMGFAQFTFIHKHHFPYEKIKKIAGENELKRIAAKSGNAFKLFFGKKEEPGKLQMLIQLAPDAFKKYGIELSGTAIKWYDKKKKLQQVASLKGLNNLSELRSLDWAKKFYCAGLDEEVLEAQVKLVLFVLEMSLYTMQIKIGSDYFVHYYKSSPALRGLIQEAYNNRPAYLVAALKHTSTLLSPKGQVPAGDFLKTLKTAIVDQYHKKENDKEKGERLTGKY